MKIVQWLSPRSPGSTIWSNLLQKRWISETESNPREGKDVSTALRKCPGDSALAHTPWAGSSPVRRVSIIPSAASEGPQHVKSPGRVRASLHQGSLPLHSLPQRPGLCPRPAGCRCCHLSSLLMAVASVVPGHVSYQLDTERHSDLRSHDASWPPGALLPSLPSGCLLEGAVRTEICPVAAISVTLLLQMSQAQEGGLHSWGAAPVPTWLWPCWTCSSRSWPCAGAGRAVFGCRPGGSQEHLLPRWAAGGALPLPPFTAPGDLGLQSSKQPSGLLADVTIVFNTH